MELKCIIEAKRKKFYAEGLFDGKGIKVLAGSKINLEGSKSLAFAKQVSKAKNDSSIVNDGGIVLKDVYFKSASTAAQFITGNSTNGLRAWKDIESKRPIKEFV